METVADLNPIFTAGIFLFAGLTFFIGFLGILMTVFGLMLRPLKKQLENHVTKTDEKIEELKAGQKDLGKKIDDLYKILLSDRKNQK